MAREGGQGPSIFAIPIDIFKWISLFAVINNFGLWKQSSQKSWTRLNFLQKPWKIRVNELIFRTYNITKNYLKWLTLLKKLFLRIFQGFCPKVSEDLFYRTPCIFVVNRLCKVFLRYSRIMLTIRSIIKSF